MRIVISGHTGFVGGHLLRNLNLHFPNHKFILLNKEDFLSENFNDKIQKEDFIYHLAGVNRAETDKEVYSSNIKINSSLLNHLEKIKFKGKLYFSSSLQEESDSIYGKAKKQAREDFKRLSEKLGFTFYFSLTPNVFGTFCKPFYNSFIATFSHQLINNQSPKIITDNTVKLIYIDDHINSLLSLLENRIDQLNFNFHKEIKVSEVLEKLKLFYNQYIKENKIPDLGLKFDKDLFNTFRSYINHENFYPRAYQLHSDRRGSFIELSKTLSSGQSSYSTTNSGVTRGNHFHTRKIERFSIIKGKAKIELRKYLTDEIISFELDDNSPSYVDMPLWYTHNITNIGDEELLTFFWINELYDKNDADTYPEIV
ncbi:NAD-dependent epimerase/dehydratase family protein [Flavobacteriaceae bacterium]|nr:NAD-dependent epimerase/dehydratase family protein [Flavobacteriaceae bacterium]